MQLTPGRDSAIVNVASRGEQSTVVLLTEGHDQLIVGRVLDVALLEDKVPSAGITVVFRCVHEDSVEARKRDL